MPRRRLAGTVERFKISIDNGVPVVLAHARKQAVAGNTGIVDQNPRQQRFGLELLKQGADGIAAGDVEHHPAGARL